MLSVKRIFKTSLFCITHTDRYRRAPAAAARGQQSRRHAGTGGTAPSRTGAGVRWGRKSSEGEAPRGSRAAGTGGRQSSPPPPPPCQGSGPGCMPRPSERDWEHGPDPPTQETGFPEKIRC